MHARGGSEDGFESTLKPAVQIGGTLCPRSVDLTQHGVSGGCFQGGFDEMDDFISLTWRTFVAESADAAFRRRAPAAGADLQVFRFYTCHCLKGGEPHPPLRLRDLPTVNRRIYLKRWNRLPSSPV
jgi:hypothetical protein